MSDMLGKKLRWGGKQRLQSKAELFPHVIDRHGLACRTLTSRGKAFPLDNYVNCMYGAYLHRIRLSTGGTWLWEGCMYDSSF